MTTSPLIDIQNVSFCYRYDKLALNGASLSIPAGSRVALVGSNGAGKSTLFLQINAILRPQSGTLYYCGQPYSYSRQAVNTLRQKVGLVFQDPETQLFAATVLDDVLFGPMNMGLSPAEARLQAETALTLVGLWDQRDDPIHFLSQGQKKRAAIAGILAMQPEILVMDEPAAALDYPSVMNLKETLAMLHRDGKTLLIATHDVDWAWQWADLVYVMSQGQVIAGGTPQEILARQDHAGLGFAKPMISELYTLLCKQGLLPDEPEQLPDTLEDLVARLPHTGR